MVTKINPKDRSMIIRVAGNIAGSVFATWESNPDEEFTHECVAFTAVSIAKEIVKKVNEEIDGSL